MTPVILDNEELKRCQQVDTQMQALRNKEGFYLSSNGLIYKARRNNEHHDKLVVPKELRPKILASHGGQRKTLALIRQQFF